jgi:hypothetical protein
MGVSEARAQSLEQAAMKKIRESMREERDEGRATTWKVIFDFAVAACLEYRQVKAEEIAVFLWANGFPTSAIKVRSVVSSHELFVRVGRDEYALNLKLLTDSYLSRHPGPRGSSASRRKPSTSGHSRGALLPGPYRPQEPGASGGSLTFTSGSTTGCPTSTTGGDDAR